MLGIGLMLFCLRGMKPQAIWPEAPLRTAFWSLNIGLSGMALFTLLPIGVLQLQAAIGEGYWFARSAEFMQQPIIDMLVWMRVPGDTIFSVGAVALAWFVARLWIKPRTAPVKVEGGVETVR
jgi:nitric oxide reductase subunit B